MNSVTIGALMIVGFVVIYIYALYLVERRLSIKNNKKLIRNLDKIKK